MTYTAQEISDFKNNLYQFSNQDLLNTLNNEQLSIISINEIYDRIIESQWGEVDENILNMIKIHIPSSSIKYLFGIKELSTIENFNYFKDIFSIEDLNYIFIFSPNIDIRNESYRYTYENNMLNQESIIELLKSTNDVTYGIPGLNKFELFEEFKEFLSVDSIKDILSYANGEFNIVLYNYLLQIDNIDSDFYIGIVNSVKEKEIIDDAFTHYINFENIKKKINEIKVINAEDMNSKHTDFIYTFAQLVRKTYSGFVAVESYNILASILPEFFKNNIENLDYIRNRSAILDNLCMYIEGRYNEELTNELFEIIKPYLSWSKLKECIQNYNNYTTYIKISALKELLSKDSMNDINFLSIISSNTDNSEIKDLCQRGIKNIPVYEYKVFNKDKYI